MEFMILKCPDCLDSIIARQYYTLNDMLEHHFLAHEREIPQETMDRIEVNPNVIGFRNDKSWTNVFGETYHSNTPNI